MEMYLISPSEKVVTSIKTSDWFQAPGLIGGRKVAATIVYDWFDLKTVEMDSN